MADIRWEQRFSNYRKAVKKLATVVDSIPKEQLSELEKEGLVQRFEYTYELAWKTMQDLLRHKGYSDIAGPTPVLDQAFKDGYITDGRQWREMKKSRELSSHTYDEETANDIIMKIYSSYYSLFIALEERLQQETSGNEDSMFN